MTHCRHSDLEVKNNPILSRVEARCADCNELHWFIDHEVIERGGLDEFCGQVGISPLVILIAIRPISKYIQERKVD